MSRTSEFGENENEFDLYRALVLLKDNRVNLFCPRCKHSWERHGDGKVGCLQQGDDGRYACICERARPTGVRLYLRGVGRYDDDPFPTVEDLDYA